MGEIEDRMYREALEMLRIANQAVWEARQENARLGIPDTFFHNGKVHYIMPDGEITSETPEIFKRDS